MTSGTDETALDELRAHVRASAGLATPDDQALLRAANTRLRETGESTLASYARRVREDAGGERHALVEEIRNGETYFFRDHGQMTLLRGTILPRIIGRHREDRTLRIWSAGCSTGEEPYSIAMLVDELLPERTAWRVHILGTDIHRPSLQRAVEGLYGANSFRPQAPMSALARARHFQREPGGWRLSRTIREMVRFEQHNLARDPLGAQHTHMDLVVCRNVLIYFEARAARQATEKLAAALAPEGCFLVGHTELHGRAPAGIRAVFYPESILYERAVPAPVLPVNDADLPRPSHAPRTGGDVPRSPRPLPKPPAPHAEPPPPTDARDDARRAADLGLHAEAARHAMDVLRAAPDDVAMHHLLAHIAEETGDEEEARSRLRRVIYLDPGNIEAHLHLALLHEHAGDPTRAHRLRAAALSLARALPPDAPIAGFEDLTAGKLTARLRDILRTRSDERGPAHD